MTTSLYPKWEELQWRIIRQRVEEVQQKIFYASRDNDLTLTRNLQNFLIHMQDAIYLAVYIVTTKNTGKNTPGVDECLALSDEDKYYLTSNLLIDGKTSLVRRVWIPKPASKERRPLGILTIQDRCKQCLIKLALEPEFEANFETHSFGFRPGRTTHDAIYRIRQHLFRYGECYVFDADIRKCFDRINHSILRQKLNALPEIETQINAWLTAGVLDGNEIFNPDLGTSQGGVISPLLANIALNGCQKYIFDNIQKYFGTNEAYKVLYVRYADDFVILGPSEAPMKYAKDLAVAFFNSIGLEIKESSRFIKTIEYTPNEKRKVKSNNFEFLGFLFKQRIASKHKAFKTVDGKKSLIHTYVLPAPSRIARHKASITALLKKIGTVEQFIDQVNPRITGWCNYFKVSDAKFYGDYPRKLDLWMNSKARKWIRKSTKLRGKVTNFWKQDTRDWILCYNDSEGKQRTLTKYNSYKWNISKYRPPLTGTSPYQIYLPGMINK